MDYFHEATDIVKKFDIDKSDLKSIYECYLENDDDEKTSYLCLLYEPDDVRIKSFEHIVKSLLRKQKLCNQYVMLWFIDTNSSYINSPPMLSASPSPELYITCWYPCHNSATEAGGQHAHGKRAIE